MPSFDHVAANGLRFAYLSEGSGPLVLLLHGFPDSAHTWERVLPELARAGYHAVAPFMRGYHPTEIPRDAAYDIDTLGRDALALIDAFGDAPAVLVGHDWGAAAGYAAAAQRPERLRLLVTLGMPHPRSLKPTPKLLWHMRHALVLRRPSGGATVRANDFAYVDELWHRWSPAWKQIPPEETAHAKQALREPGCAEAAAAYYAALGPRLPASYRQRIRVPTVAFAGEHDLIATRAYEKARHEVAASYEVVQVPGGHFLHREHSHEFNTELLRVLHHKAPR